MSKQLTLHDLDVDDRFTIDPSWPYESDTTTVFKKVKHDSSWILNAIGGAICDIIDTSAFQRDYNIESVPSVMPVIKVEQA